MSSLRSAFTKRSLPTALQTNSTTAAFWLLKQLVNRFGGRKIFLIVDNAPHHNLSADGKKWLRDNSLAIEIHRLPPYSPEFMPVEGIWKKTRKLTTHNTFYTTVNERDTALRKTFTRFQRKPETLDSMVARFR